MKILVSACLLGLSCRYDGYSKPNEQIIALSQKHELIPFCPEIYGGLPTPRDPSERVGNKVISSKGLDVTALYQKGAEETLRICRLLDCDLAILKEKSPSCGSHEIYDGTFSRVRVPGMGITAQLLRQNGINVLSDEDDLSFLK